jgi:hypothetical protein
MPHGLVGSGECRWPAGRVFVVPADRRRRNEARQALRRPGSGSASGIGARLIDQVVSPGRAAACETLILAVNKRNERAIAAYGKQGFAVRESVCVDIGNGFVMDDFIMAKSLLHRPPRRLHRILNDDETDICQDARTGQRLCRARRHSPVDRTDAIEQLRLLADRHFGIGCDQILLVEAGRQPASISAIAFSTPTAAKSSSAATARAASCVSFMSRG